MASPTLTSGSAGNGLASTTVAASASTTPFTLDVSLGFVARVQWAATFGTVAATSGLQILVYGRVGTTPVNDTNAITTFTIPAVGSTSAVGPSFDLPTGRYSIKATNLDATNGLTAVSCTYDLTPAVS